MCFGVNKDQTRHQQETDRGKHKFGDRFARQDRTPNGKNQDGCVQADQREQVDPPLPGFQLE